MVESGLLKALPARMLKEVDDYHVQWALTCPTCLSELSGVIPKEGWLCFSPTCPKCRCVIVGFVNPFWSPAFESMPMTKGIWGRFISVLDLINEILQPWRLSRLVILVIVIILASWNAVLSFD